MPGQGVVESMAQVPLVGQVQNTPSRHAVELAQLGLERIDLAAGQAIERGGVETAELCDVEQRPGSVRVRGAGGG